MRGSICSFSLYLFPFPKHLPASICWTFLHVKPNLCRPTFPFSPAALFLQGAEVRHISARADLLFSDPLLSTALSSSLMATVCDLVKSCVLLLLKIHDSVMITTPPYASCLVLIVNVSHCDVQWYLFFRIRYYTLRLAKSDVFTPKLWEAKWIVDEVSCNLKVSMT